MLLNLTLRPATSVHHIIQDDRIEIGYLGQERYPQRSRTKKLFRVWE